MTAHPPQDEDLVDAGAPLRPAGPRPRWRLSALVGAVLVVTAAVVGLDVGQHHADRHEPNFPSSTSPPSASTVAPALLQIDGSSGCGTLDGGVLFVAFAVLNTGGQGLVIDDVRPVLPLPGLRPLGGAVDRPPAAVGCPDAVLRQGDTVPANSGGWISLAFKATSSCLTPLPIGVDIVYASDGHTITTRLNPFPDLGGVAAAARDCPTVAMT